MLKITPLTAIRAKCIDCCAGQLKEVRLCQITDCSLHPFRFGTNPLRKRSGKGRNLQDNQAGMYPDKPPMEIVEKSPSQQPISCKETILEEYPK